MTNIELGNKINVYRNQKNYTQEKLAQLCGVSNVAVSKWENGTSCPDISILPILARIFNTTIDDLLSFEKELTNEEVLQLAMQSAAKFNTQSFDEAFQYAKELVHTYPNSELLKLRLANNQMYVSVSVKEEENQAIYQAYVKELLDQITDSSDLQLKQAACILLSSQYCMEKEYEKAELVLHKIPVLMDTSSMQGNILLGQKKYEEAYELYQNALLRDIRQIELSLITLANIASQCGDKEEMPIYLQLQKDMSNIFHTDIMLSIKPITEAYVTDKKEAIQNVREYMERLKNMDTQFVDMNTKLQSNPWFRHIKLAVPRTPTDMWKGNLMKLLEDESLDYLRDEPDFQKIVEEIKAYEKGLGKK